MAAEPVFELDAIARLGVRVERLVNDSRCVCPGDVFLAYPGERADGRAFIKEAIAAGAAAVLWEAEGFDRPAGFSVPNLPVRGLRERAGVLAARLAGDPSAALWMVGVTGTNGKTSCSHWIGQALSALGRRTALIGTLGSGHPGMLDASVNTTPDALVLHRLLARFLADGASAVAMEVSSHGLVQGRVSGARFDVALFTNLTRDHLDYHGDMERYFAAKARLFDWPELRHAVVNVDDAWGRRLVDRLRTSAVNVLTYGFGEATIAGHRLDLGRMGLELEIVTPWGAGVVASSMMGAHNAANLLGVLGVLVASDIPLADALAVLPGLNPVPGRMQSLGADGEPRVVVDYAHTPDALAHVLEALRAHVPGGRLLCVFGCGGERDRGKRPQMGEIATRLADRTIITSDNPRSEDPAAIIAEVAAGARGRFAIEPDRARAIEQALAEAGPGDVVLVAGKGHEAWQEIAGERLAFDDVVVARAALSRRAQARP